MSMQDAAPMRDPQSYRGHGGCSFGLYIYIYIYTLVQKTSDHKPPAVAF